MNTTTTEKAMAMTAAFETCMRPWRGSNTAHSGDLAVVQGRSVPVAGRVIRDAIVTGGHFSGVPTAPTTGYVYPRLEAPPV